MARQYFAGLTAEPPIANLTAITGTTETGLWLPASYSPIAANEAVPGKVWRVSAGGIMSFAATGTLTLTPRFGLTTSGITMGASVVPLTTPGATTANAWWMQFTCVCRTVGAPGANSSVIGTGMWCSGFPAAGSLPATCMLGGTSAAVDVSIATGLFIGWTLSVAGTVTPQWVTMEALN